MFVDWIKDRNRPEGESSEPHFSLRQLLAQPFHEYFVFPAMWRHHQHKNLQTRPQGLSWASGDLGSRSPPKVGKTSIHSAHEHLSNACGVPRVAIMPFPSLLINHFFTSKNTLWFQPLLQWSPKGNTQRSLVYPGKGAFMRPLDSKGPPGILSQVSSLFQLLTHLGTDQLTQSGWCKEAPFPVTYESTHYTLLHLILHLCLELAPPLHPDQSQ